MICGLFASWRKFPLKTCQSFANILNGVFYMGTLPPLRKKQKKRKKKGKKRKEKERKTDYLKINSNKLVWQVTPYEVFTK